MLINSMKHFSVFIIVFSVIFDTMYFKIINKRHNNLTNYDGTT